MDLAVQDWLDDRGTAQRSVNEFVVGFEERRVVLEVAQSRVSTVDDELQIELFSSRDDLSRRSVLAAETSYIATLCRFGESDRRV